MDKNITIGSTVETNYNSGKYIGKVIEDRRNSWLVEVEAVLKHPTQGDLHNPNTVDNVAFHERKAIGPREKINARKRKTKLYTGDVPEYVESLKQAVTELKSSLNNDDAFGKLSLEKIADLETSFYNKLY